MSDLPFADSELPTTPEIEAIEKTVHSEKFKTELKEIRRNHHSKKLKADLDELKEKAKQDVPAFETLNNVSKKPGDQKTKFFGLSYDPNEAFSFTTMLYYGWQFMAYFTFGLFLITLRPWPYISSIVPHLQWIFYHACLFYSAAVIGWRVVNRTVAKAIPREISLGMKIWALGFWTRSGIYGKALYLYDTVTTFFKDNYDMLALMIVSMAVYRQLKKKHPQLESKPPSVLALFAYGLKVGGIVAGFADMGKMLTHKHLEGTSILYDVFQALKYVFEDEKDYKKGKKESSDPLEDDSDLENLTMFQRLYKAAKQIYLVHRVRIVSFFIAVAIGVIAYDYFHDGRLFNWSKFDKKKKGKNLESQSDEDGDLEAKGKNKAGGKGHLKTHLVNSKNKGKKNAKFFVFYDASDRNAVKDFMFNGEYTEAPAVGQPWKKGKYSFTMYDSHGNAKEHEVEVTDEFDVTKLKKGSKLHKALKMNPDILKGMHGEDDHEPKKKSGYKHLGNLECAVQTAIDENAYQMFNDVKPCKHAKHAGGVCPDVANKLGAAIAKQLLKVQFKGETKKGVCVDVFPPLPGADTKALIEDNSNLAKMQLEGKDPALKSDLPSPKIKISPINSQKPIVIPSEPKNTLEGIVPSNPKVNVNGIKYCQGQVLDKDGNFLSMCLSTWAGIVLNTHSYRPDGQLKFKDKVHPMTAVTHQEFCGNSDILIVKSFDGCPRGLPKKCFALCEPGMKVRMIGMTGAESFETAPTMGFEEGNQFGSAIRAAISTDEGDCGSPYYNSNGQVVGIHFQGGKKHENNVFFPINAAFLATQPKN